MLVRGKFLFGVTPEFVLILLVFATFSVGCSLASPEATLDKPFLTANEHKRVEGSLELEVVDFDWTYINDGAHLVVRGEVVNNSGKPQQALTLYASVYDEGGSPVGAGQSYLVPTYIPVGAQASFELTFMPRRTEGIKFLKIITNTRMLQ